MPMSATRQAARRKERAGAQVRDLEIERQAGVLVLTLGAPRQAQQPVGSDAGRAALRHRRGWRGCRRAGRRHRRQRHDLLRRPRSQGAERAAQRCRRRARLLRDDHAPVRRDDALDRALSEARDRRGAGHGHGRRLPARRLLRPGGGRRGGELCHARRQHRPVLLDADGGAVAQRPAQAGDGDAAAGRDAAGRRQRRSTGSSTAWCRRAR